MSPIFDCRDEAQLLTGMRQARQAIGRGELVVLPTDTVYGIAANAFDAQAVARLLEAKGRGRQSPPPVLVAGLTTLRALVAEVPEPVERLVERSGRAGSPSSCPSQPSLTWDLGETRGTVAVRMPAHRIALELLEETGPLAVSSANLTARLPRSPQTTRKGCWATASRSTSTPGRPPRDRLDDHRRDELRRAAPEPHGAGAARGRRRPRRACARCWATCWSRTRRSRTRREAVRLHDHLHGRDHLRPRRGRSGDSA